MSAGGPPRAQAKLSPFKLPARAWKHRGKKILAKNLLQPGKRGRSHIRAHLSLPQTHILFILSDLTQFVRQSFVNFSPVADGENPENPRFTIQFVNDAKSSDFEAPQSS
jgi:hypothetical protein